ncbi:MAG: hypothetical protein P8188_14670, partial [Gemmatimonadota bacterium]
MPEPDTPPPSTLHRFDQLAWGRCREPFGFLGIHPDPDGGWVVRVFLPWATSVELRAGSSRIDMTRVHEAGGWLGRLPSASGLPGAPAYHLAVLDQEGRE